MNFVENVIPALKSCLDEDKRVALVTLIHIEGTSPRPLGSQLGVCEDGKYVGMITGGCAEKAIAAETLQCLERGENRTVRYGEGSPYVDVVLPCGSGIDLFIETGNCPQIVELVDKAHAQREPAYFIVDKAQARAFAAMSAPSPSENEFCTLLMPDYRILCFGEGPNIVSFCTNAKAAGFRVEAYSPDENALALLRSLDVQCQPIYREFDFGTLSIDRYSGVVTLFHEHDWEINILKAALNSDAHYIGALGSKRTHQARLESLKASPSLRRPLEDIHGPVGLDIGAKNPNEIAISILAEIIELRRRARS